MIHIEEENMSEEFKKLHLKGLPFDAVIHHFTEPDKGDFHDHPFGFYSFVLHGAYVERRAVWDVDRWEFFNVTRESGSCFFVLNTTIHKIIELSEGGCYTIILPKEKVREPGFWRFPEAGGALFRQWNEKEWKKINY